MEERFEEKLLELQGESEFSKYIKSFHYASLVSFIKKEISLALQQVQEEKERLEHDYSCVLDYATKGKVSKTNYYLNDIYSVIDEAQQESIEGIIRDDIEMITKKSITRRCY